jgi:hypothetical protein
VGPSPDAALEAEGMQVVEKAFSPGIKRLRIRLDSKKEWAGINPQGLNRLRKKA